MTRQNSPLTDIIVPTFEKQDLTVNCFNSIRAFTTPGTYRVIWVDNASKETINAEAALLGVDHLFIKQSTNRGFVGAVNAGLAQSDAPYVCLLNNDTIVTPRWLEKLLAHLERDPKLGIVGAMTGPVKNREYDSQHCFMHHQHYVKECPQFPKFINFIDFNKKLERQLSGKLGEVAFVAFLCAVIKREVIEKVTALDECYKDGLDTNYELGLWDDNDYNLAARKVGYTSALALDTCIYHAGRSTFKILEKHVIDRIHDNTHAYFLKQQTEGILAGEI